MNERKKTVLIVEDHPLVREGIVATINKEDKFKVVKETSDGAKALAFAQKNLPDLAIVDIHLAGSKLNGIELTDALKKTAPKVSVIILTMHTNTTYIGQALDAGALGFVNKQSISSVLHDAISTVVQGKRYVDSDLIPKIAKKLLGPISTNGQITNDAYSSLTMREQEVLRLYANSLSSKDIAKKLSISPSTVDNHRASIYKKLSIKNRAGLLQYCIGIGLLGADNY